MESQTSEHAEEGRKKRKPTSRRAHNLPPTKLMQTCRGRHQQIWPPSKRQASIPSTNNEAPKTQPKISAHPAHHKDRRRTASQNRNCRRQPPHPNQRNERAATRAVKERGKRKSVDTPEVFFFELDTPEVKGRNATYTNEPTERETSSQQAYKVGPPRSPFTSDQPGACPSRELRV